MNKMLTRVFNFKNSPGTIIKFQWKNNTMKSLCTDDMKQKSEENIDEETFLAFMESIEQEDGIVGPWQPGSTVQRCCPKIQW